MQKLSHILKRVFFLPPLPTILIAVPSLILVFCVLASGAQESPLAYASYLLSAYALVLLITGMPDIILAVRDKFQNIPFVKKLLGTAFGQRFKNDALFRTELSLYQGFFINLSFAAFKLITGILFRSVWLVSLSVYYTLLTIMRASLLHYVRRTPVLENIPAELRYYRRCGGFLLILNAELAVLVGFIVQQNKGFFYPDPLIYVMALYAFYCVINAIVNVIRFRKHGSPVMSAAKMINLTSALVTMLALTTAMLAIFDRGDSSFRRLMTGSVGAGVCLLVLGMAVFMLFHSTKELHACQKNRV